MFNDISALLDRLESGDQLVVLKLDRLGRDNIDVQKTIEQLVANEIKPIVLDLPVHDLSSSEGKLMLQMFSAFAEFERNRIRERTKEVLELQAKGFTQSKVAEYLNVSIRTISRHWKQDKKQG